MKIGIYTIHRCCNYGAMLQAYATQAALKAMGHEAEIVNVSKPQEGKRNPYIKKPHSLKQFALSVFALVNPKVWKKAKAFATFHNEMSLSPHFDSFAPFYDKPLVYDIHLVGSDQVWNLEGGMKAKMHMFLDFLTKGEKRVSYASSFGNPNLPEKSFPRLKELLTPFTAISTRERSGVELIKRAMGIDAAHVLDPTFLLTAEQWQKLCDPEPIVKGKYLLFYGIAMTSYTEGVMRRLSGALNLPIVAISVSTHIPFKVDKFVQAAGPKEFINLVAHATYVLTGSFHGLAFALNFHKDFVVLGYGKRMSRMEDLCKLLEIPNRIVYSVEQLSELLKEAPQVDYSKSAPKMEAERTNSIEYLRLAISKCANEKNHV